MRFPEEPGFNALAPFNAPPRQRPQTTVKQKKQMLCYGRQMKDILRSRTPYYKIKLRVVVLEMLIQICESWREAAKWGRRAPSKEFSQINRAVQMVFNSRSFISTLDAARACGLDRHVFSSLFKSWMNISFAEFSMKHRLHQAAMQVRDTLEPIKSIALHWGFVDESHFYRVFMRHFGMSPYEYRKRMFSAHCPDG
jgi:AraC-like DNA-binding protein